jgi:hypothetical protein
VTNQKREIITVERRLSRFENGAEASSMAEHFSKLSHAATVAIQLDRSGPAGTQLSEFRQQDNEFFNQVLPDFRQYDSRFGEHDSEIFECLLCSTL